MGWATITCRFPQGRPADRRPEYRQHVGTIGSDGAPGRIQRLLRSCFRHSLFVLGRTVVPSSPTTADRLPGRFPQAGEAPLVLIVNDDVPGTSSAQYRCGVRPRSRSCFFALSFGNSDIATLAFLKRTGLPLDTILCKGASATRRGLVAASSSFIKSVDDDHYHYATCRTRVSLTSKERTPLAPNIPRPPPRVRLEDFFSRSSSGL